MLIDPTILDLARLREVFEDDREGIIELLDLAVQNVRTQLDTIAGAVPAQDTAAVRAAAHAIKGALLNVGAVEAARLATELETAARSGDWGAIPPGASALEAAFARLAESVTSFAQAG